MSNATLITNARERATILERVDPLYPVQPSMLRELADALETAERAVTGQIEKDAAIAQGHGIIGRNLEPYWEGFDDATEKVANAIRAQDVNPTP